MLFRRGAITLAVAFALVGSAASQTATQHKATRPKPVACTQRPAFHQFDYWAGKWEVFTPDHRKTADTTVEPVLNGCALSETWTSTHSASGNGRGLSTYNPATKQWEYFWVAANGYTSFWTGRLAKNAMRFTAVQPSSGATALRRWSMIHLPDGRIEELATSSADGGKTWKTQYTLYWVRHQ